MFKHILAPTDGSKLSLRALEMALGMAEAHTAKLTVMTVVAPYPPLYAGDGYMISPLTVTDWQAATEGQKKAIEESVDKCVAKWNKSRTSGLPATPRFVVVENNNVYEGIINVAKKGKCDLIVMASHGRRGLSALLLGSETNKVLTHSTISVLVCR